MMRKDGAREALKLMVEAVENMGFAEYFNGDAFERAYQNALAVLQEPADTAPAEAKAVALPEGWQAELLDWVSSCECAYHIDSTPGHRFAGLGSTLEENRAGLVEYVAGLLASHPAPAPAAAEAKAVEYEERRAIMEGERNAACEEYFRARPHFNFVRGGPKIFEDGFQRGYEAKGAPAPAAAEADKRDAELAFFQEHHGSFRNALLMAKHTARSDCNFEGAEKWQALIDKLDAIAAQKEAGR